MTVREFIETCEDKDATMFSLFEEGLYLLGTTCKNYNESYFNKFLEKYGEKKVKSWHLKSSRLGDMYTIVLA